jgi:hypothetical protein
VHFLVTVAVLVSAPPSGGAGARLDEARAAIAAAERARGVDVVEDPEALVAAGWTAERNLAFFARGAQLVSDGRRALARVELEKAEALLGEAERAYEAKPAWPGARAEWAEAAKWHGVALFELKRREPAMRAWARAKGLLADSPLTEAMVRPEVATAFAAVRAEPTAETAAPAHSLADLDAEIVRVAVAVDAGRLTYAAVRQGDGCETQPIVSTRADELVARLHAATCERGHKTTLAAVDVIAHPRASPSLTGSRGKAAASGERRTPVWRRPWLWVGVVGAVGVGVVLAASLWPRDAGYTATADFHSFALGGR